MSQQQDPPSRWISGDPQDRNSRLSVPEDAQTVRTKPTSWQGKKK